MTDKEALKLALEALETLMLERGSIYEKAIAVIKQALAAPVQPVACNACNGSGFIVRDPDIGTDQECFVCDGTGVSDDATLPAAQRQWVGMTDDEIKLQWSVFWEAECHPWAIDFARAIEAKLKEKNT
jgi:hypothetical protein